MASKEDPSRRFEPTEQDGDGRVSLSPLDPVTALRALLAVDPESEPVEAHESVDRREEALSEGAEQEKGAPKDA